MPRLGSTRELPIGGGQNYPRTADSRERYLLTLHNNTGLPVERVRSLFERYGTRAEAIARFSAQQQPDSSLRSTATYSRAEIQFIAIHEKVVRLDDLILRRTLMAMLGELDGALLEELAALLGEALEWDDHRRQTELNRTLDLLADVHGVTL